MTFVTRTEMENALRLFRIPQNAIVLTHSSLKALGQIEGGAEGVISALESIVPEGTLVFPTLSSKNWDTVFEDWSLNRPSDVGLISETFRLQDGTLRSDNATHSVAARGRNAADLVAGHSDGGARIGVFGDYCFSKNSAWQKMYDAKKRYGVEAYVLFWGVSMRYNTFKHFSEYRFVEELLSAIPNEEERERRTREVARYPFPATATEDDLLWPFYDSFAYQETLFGQGIAKKVRLGDGEVICCNIKAMVDSVDYALRENTEEMVRPHVLKWIKTLRK